MPNTKLATRRVLLPAMLSVFVSVGCSNDPVQSAMEDECTGDACDSEVPQVDFTADEPTYTAKIHVVDSAGKPVEGAEVQVGDKMLRSDADGRIAMPSVSAKQPALLKARREGHMPHVSHTDPQKSASAAQEVTLLPVKVQKEVDPQARVHVADEGAQVDLEARSLSDSAGTRAKSARVEMSSPKAGSIPESAKIGGGTVIGAGGQTTLVERIYGFAYVRFTDAAGTELNLAQGQPARIQFELPADAGLAEGDSLGLWSLDERTGHWHEESFCTVGQSAGRTVCQGPVPHFSVWAVGRSVRVDRPGAVGCMNVSLALEEGSCFKVKPVSWSYGHCDTDGQSCTRVAPALGTFLFNGTDLPSQCSVLQASESQRVAVTYYVDASGCTEDSGIESGLYVKLSDAVGLTSFKDVVGSKVILPFTFDADRACTELCEQVTVTIESSDATSTRYRDADGDGWMKGDGSDAPPYPWTRTDCDDADAATHPFAAEIFCVEGDRNCDGVSNGVKRTLAEVGDSFQWNYHCGMCPDIEKGEEVAGNAFDEDCDGVVSDRDEDGVNEPEDCDDFDPGVTPGKPEIAGNFADEDCDGAVADHDGDGVLDARHVHLAEALGFDPLVLDCDDYDPAVLPGGAPADEAGALGIYFYEQGAEIRRRAEYCSLFNANGSPNVYFQYATKDLNCDGVLTDIDGDGFTAVGDTSLGAERAIDCNDLDPRVAPASVEEPACSEPEALPNDLDCSARLPAEGECPVLRLSGTLLSTICQESANQDGTGTGLGVCSYVGWPDGNPLSIEPGTLWGPCDGDGGLPECPEGSSCGGPLNYTDALTGYLQSAFNEDQPLHFKGMCFPACSIRD